MKILFTTHAKPQFLPPTIIDAQEVVAGPYYNHVKRGPLQFKYFNTPRGLFDFQECFGKLPAEQQPELVMVHIDATLACLPRNIPDHCRKVLMVGGATHILEKPLQNIIAYAREEKFETIFVWNRQNAHWFKELGFPNVFWMPALTFAIPQATIPENKANQICFFGQLGKYHPRRTRILEALQQAGIQIVGGQLPRKDSLQLVTKSTLSLNATLNGEFNLRVFETSAHNTLLVSDKISHFTGMELFFPDSEALVTYVTPDEAAEKIQYLLNNPQETTQLAIKGKAIHDRHFSFDARRQAFFDLLEYKGDYPHLKLVDEPRCSLPQVTQETDGIFLKRVQTYELVQELHRNQESVRILHLPGSPLLFVSDLADLARVKQLKAEIKDTYDSQWTPALNELQITNCSQTDPENIDYSTNDLTISSTEDLGSPNLQQALDAQKLPRILVWNMSTENHADYARRFLELGYERPDSSVIGLFARKS